VRAREPDGEARVEALLREMAAMRPPVRVVPKAGLWHQRAIDRLLRALTLGGQSRYLTDYVTTLGRTILVPDGWGRVPALRRYEVLRHELVHVRQFERWGWVGMVLIYGLFPLPVGLAWGRARLEWEAYAETLRVTAEVEGIAAARDPKLHAEIVARFTGPDYAWMWPFPATVQRWIDACVAEIEREATEASSR
jgi:hypothetical protein